MPTGKTTSAVDATDLSRTPLEQVFATLGVEVQDGLSDTLVSGDMVRQQAGDFIPADARLVGR